VINVFVSVFGHLKEFVDYNILKGQRERDREEKDRHGKKQKKELDR